MAKTVTGAISRRLWAHQIAAAAAAMWAGWTSRTAIAADADGANAKFIALAADMRERALANGDQAFGAIIVLDTRVVGIGPSQVVTHQDPTAHAEMVAIRAACQTLGRNDLGGCVMYSTSHPCGMCETAAYWAHVSELRFGAAGQSSGAPRYCSC